MDWQFLLFNPNGRIGQKDFWIGAAILLGGNVLANILPILGGLLWLLLIWVGICVYGKRLHDIGLPGGWAIALFIPPAALPALIALSLWPTGSGPNRFGPGPEQTGH